MMTVLTTRLHFRLQWSEAQPNISPPMSVPTNVMDETFDCAALFWYWSG